MSQSLNNQLLLLRDPLNPLLKKMRQKSPWTYFHSLLVWEVAYFACLNFNNTNPLLAMVWARFHDIWKMIQPFAYAENQEDWDYPFMPEIIETHVSHWVDMAKAFNLPDEVARFIVTHHWTANCPSNKWEEMKRYALSEKPITVEETLVMLADSSEAAVRSLLQECTKSNIAKIVRKVFYEKEQNDQLTNSVLLSADFKQVEDDFIDSFYYVYHRRFATEKKDKY